MAGERTRALTVLRAFSRRVLNPMVRHWAGSRWSPVALLGHVGRRSGREYVTPLLARRIAGGYVIALTYGEITDWYRNLVAANGGWLRWHGQEYRVWRPGVIARAEAISAFLPWERAIVRLVGIAQFVRLDAILATSSAKA